MTPEKVQAFLNIVVFGILAFRSCNTVNESFIVHFRKGEAPLRENPATPLFNILMLSLITTSFSGTNHAYILIFAATAISLVGFPLEETETSKVKWPKQWRNFSRLINVCGCITIVLDVINIIYNMPTEI